MPALIDVERSCVTLNTRRPGGQCTSTRCAPLPTPRSKDRSLRQLLHGTCAYPVGAVAGCFFCLLHSRPFPSKLSPPFAAFIFHAAITYFCTGVRLALVPHLRLAPRAETARSIRRSKASLNGALYSETGQYWQGDELWRAIKAIPMAERVQDPVGDSGLPPLYPK
ncbi:BatD family protein [Pseudomonas sp. AP3_22 TE3818]